MAGIKYSETQIAELKQNKYVKNVTQRHIIFTKACKEEVLRLTKQWLFYREIFEKLGFPEYVVSSKIPQRNFHRWNNKQKNWSIEDKKWRPKKSGISTLDINNMTQEEYIEYLETKVLFLEELKKVTEKWFP